MNRFLAFLLLFMLVVLAIEPAAFAFGDGVTVAPLRLDFSPLIPVVNGFIIAIAGVLSAAVPVFVGLLGKWLWSHGIQVSQAGQKIISDRITATITNGLKFATSGADAGISKLKIDVSNPTIALAANYAILQSPDLLKKGGIDVTTEAGQQTLVRRITAESMPTPAALSPSQNTNITTEKLEQVGTDKAPS